MIWLGEEEPWIWPVGLLSGPRTGPSQVRSKKVLIVILEREVVKFLPGWRNWCLVKGVMSTEEELKEERNFAPLRGNMATRGKNVRWWLRVAASLSESRRSVGWTHAFPVLRPL